MKAQLTVKYLISFLVFIGFIVYIFLSYSANIPLFAEEVRKEVKRSRAFQLSEILLNDPGEPLNWGVSPTIKRIGLSDENSNLQNLISLIKIERLGVECSNFQNVQRWLALDRPFSIFVFNISRETGVRQLILECVSPVFPKEEINVTIRRITAYNDSGDIRLAELIVQM